MARTRPDALTLGYRASAGLLGLACVGSCVVDKFGLMFGQFSDWDDEGCLLLTLKLVHQGRALYDDVFSVYGPFPFYVKSLFLTATGLDVGHDVGRALSLGLMTAAALTAAWLVARLTGSFVAGCVGANAVLQALDPVTTDPGHPQDVCVVLMAASPLLASYATTPRRFTPIVAALGAIAGCLALSKINVGAFAVLGLGASLAVVRGPGPGPRVLAGLTLPLLPLAVVALLWPLWGEAWVRHLATVTLITLAALLAVGYLAPGPRHAAPRHAAAAAGGFLAAAGLITFVALARGTSLRGLVHGVILIGPSLGALFTVPMPHLTPSWVNPAVAGAVAVVSAAAGPRRRAVVAALAAFRLCYAWYALTILFGTYRLLPEAAMPALALLPLPTAAGARGDAAAFARVLLAFDAVFASLIAYPVAGSQVGPASLLLVAAVVVVAHDGLSDLAAVLPRPRFIRARGRCLARAAGLAVLAAVSAFQFGRTERMLAYYRSLEPLRLPGASLVRIDHPRADRLRRTTQHLRQYADVFVTMPGLNSFYLWARQGPPTGANITNWMGLLDDRSQREIIDRLAAARSPRVVVSPDMLRFWRPRPSWDRAPLRVYIRDHFREAANFNGFILCAPKERPQDK